MMANDPFPALPLEIGPLCLKYIAKVKNGHRNNIAL